MRRAVFVVVQNPQPRLLPRVLRVFLGERYLSTHIYNDWETDISRARKFFSIMGAHYYIYDQAGRVKPGMANCVIRRERDEDAPELPELHA